MSEDGKVFVRVCPGPCGKRVMTADAEGKTPCDKCAPVVAALEAEKKSKKGGDAPKGDAPKG